MTDAVVLQFPSAPEIRTGDLMVRHHVAGTPIPAGWTWHPSGAVYKVAQPGDTEWPAVELVVQPAVMGQCSRSCSPDDCEAPRCYQR